MDTSLRWLDMMQSLRGAADDWSLASESRYDRRRATDLGNFAPRLTAGVMNKCVWNLLVSSVIFCRLCFVPVPLIFWHIFCDSSKTLLFDMSWEPCQLDGFINLCRWFSGFVWQAWHMSCRLLLWNRGTRTERWMLKCPSVNWGGV